MSKPNEHRASRAVEHVVDYDSWFTTEVEKGMAAAGRGELTDHQAIRAMIESLYPAEAPRARNILSLGRRPSVGADRELEGCRPDT